MSDISTKEIFEQAKIRGKNLYKISLLPEVKISNTIELMERLNRITKKGKKALINGFYVEYLSFALLYIDFWLRLFLFGKNDYKNMNIYEDKMFFGDIIKKCKKNNMNIEILDSIKEINDLRIKYIHNYLSSDIDDKIVENKKLEINDLLNKLSSHVFIEVGIQISDDKYTPEEGDIVIGINAVQNNCFN